MTNRKIIDQLRDSLRERNADSELSNQFLYSVLEKHAKWLIRREETSGRIYKSSALFRPLKCFPVMEVSTIDEECSIQTNCKLFRTVDKLPSCWENTDGYIIKDVTTVDNSIAFAPTTYSAWKNIENNPYFKYVGKVYYYYLLDGYLYFPQKAPKEITVLGYFKRDVSGLGNCCKEKTCTRFMDEEFAIPAWIEGELMSHAVQEIAGVTEKLLPDEQIDANSLRKGQ